MQIGRFYQLTLWLSDLFILIINYFNEFSLLMCFLYYSFDLSLEDATVLWIFPEEMACNQAVSLLLTCKLPLPANSSGHLEPRNNFEARSHICVHVPVPVHVHVHVCIQVCIHVRVHVRVRAGEGGGFATPLPKSCIRPWFSAYAPCLSSPTYMSCLLL